jgi:ABC-type dipeptide/oligopeptide/nickel transport system permease component
MGQEATLAQRAALEEALGLNDPFYKQYFSFVWNALNFDFGNSYRGALPVSDLIASRLPESMHTRLIFRDQLYNYLRRDGVKRRNI